MYNITNFTLLYRTAILFNTTRLGNIFYNGRSSISSFYGSRYEWKTERSIEYSDIRAAVSGIYKSEIHTLLT